MWRAVAVVQMLQGAPVDVPHVMIFESEHSCVQFLLSDQHKLDLKDLTAVVVEKGGKVLRVTCKTNEQNL